VGPKPVLTGCRFLALVLTTAALAILRNSDPLSARHQTGELDMSTEEIKRIARRFYEEVVGTGNISLLDELISPGYEEVMDGVRFPVGLEGAKAHVAGVRQTYPDLRIAVNLQIAEGEWVASCITATGTHMGSWLGIKPTRKAVTFTGVNVDRISGGKIIEHGGAANMLGPLLEIGALKVVSE